MQLLADVSALFFGTVLALTNGLATLVESIIPYTPPATFSTLESDYAPRAPIPAILLENTSYQQAAVIGSAKAQHTPAADLADALVNIYCTQTTAAGVRTTTGSGFMIDSAGVIMTNAHVAQFLLLELVEEGVEAECVVRTGSPATAEYKAELLYISPAWIQQNAALISAAKPKGTGERDFALLFISAGLENRPLPAQFPSLHAQVAPLTPGDIGTNVTLGGYPAEAYLSASATALTLATTSSTITDIFTFGENTPDIMAIAPSAVGQFGVSGGPVLNKAGEVIGLISTKGTEAEGDTSLRALTLSNIDHAIREESTFGLEETITGQLAWRARLYTSTIATFLGRMLEAEL